ncbi:hypothetical protein TRAPUB_9311 [Trametes pubescens]|uniref:Uncharacterized protein n=1 Tax=Trametes pubescens TaxID=154538 RepID=A0A1M2W341_TRAPU|nr:hypothetical protein TRAPUB_9311 [Trametes pubescens]
MLPSTQAKARGPASSVATSASSGSSKASPCIRAAGSRRQRTREWAYASYGGGHSAPGLSLGRAIGHAENTRLPPARRYGAKRKSRLSSVTLWARMPTTTTRRSAGSAMIYQDGSEGHARAGKPHTRHRHIGRATAPGTPPATF